MLRTGATPLLALLCTLTVSVAAAAPRRRVVLVRPDAELLRSTLISLSSWDIEVVAAESSAPSASPPGVQERAADVARSLQADVVSWISGVDPAVLWTYDAETHRLGSSVLAARPPWDGPAAAAVALSLKALLRSSAVAPPNERFATAEPALPRPSTIRLEAGVGSRFVPSETASAWGALGVSLWPRSVDERIGFGVVVSAGPSARVQTPNVDGHFSDVSVRSSVRSRIRIGSRFALEPSLAGTVHWTTFDGTLAEGAGPFQDVRIDPSIDVALTADATLGGLSVGVQASFGVLLRYQHYLVGDESALSVSPIVADVMLRFTAGVF